MKLSELVAELVLEVKSGHDNLANEISGGYASDLLSDVLANGEEGDIWVTLQIHQNVVAVASVKDLAAVLIVNSREPDDETIAKANSEGIPILVSALSGFELVGRLHGLGIRGGGDKTAGNDTIGEID